MTVTVSVAWTCDLCGGETFAPTETTYQNTGEIHPPVLVRTQWRMGGCAYDLCDLCAEPMRAIFEKLTAAAYAKRAADEALEKALS